MVFMGKLEHTSLSLEPVFEVLNKEKRVTSNVLIPLQVTELSPYLQMDY